MDQQEKPEPKSMPVCPHRDCSQPQVVRNGSHRGRKRYRCKACNTFFGETQGTVMYHLKTPAAEIAQALLMVMRRGSLRAAEEITGHKDETIGVWLKRAASQAEAVTEALANDLHLDQVEIDEFWSFVQKKACHEQPDEGERWGCLIQDRASRFVIAHASGPVGEELITETVHVAVQRTGKRAFDWFSDGWKG